MVDAGPFPVGHHLRNEQVLNQMEVFIVSPVYTAVFTPWSQAKIMAFCKILTGWYKSVNFEI